MFLEYSELLYLEDKMTRKFNNVYIGDTFTIAAVYEKNGPISDYIDLIYDKDLYYGCDTFEKAEEKMLSNSISKLLSRIKLIDRDIDYVISGDLQNQIAASDYAMRDCNIPFLGIFSACATFGEGLLLGSNLIEGKVSLNDIGGENDKYRYDQERYAIISKKAHQSYHVGDKVLVEAIAASKHNRTVNFRLERKKA